MVQGQEVLDARPVALAVRAEAPLFVAERVLEEAGIPAEMAEPRSEEKLEELKKFLEEVDPEDFQG